MQHTIRMWPFVPHAAIIKDREQECYIVRKATKERVDPPTDLFARLIETAAFTKGITIQPHFLRLNLVISRVL